jgi:2-dehydro-3-deoxygalactonokinase
MSSLTSDRYKATLEALLAPWDAPDAPVIACGMVGSRQGWVEAPYRRTPCKPLAGKLTRVSDSERRAVFIIPGLSQNTPPDVMRGEETQIAGFLALNPGWDGVLCLPGTHTKWVHLSAGEVVSFQTFMTGELFGLLTTASVLRHSVETTGWDDNTFAEAVSDAMTRPERLAARLFSLRAADLLQGLDHGEANATLSGLLIGAELAAARPYWLGQNLAILGTMKQARAYQSALEAQGLNVLTVDSQAATRAGLTAAYRSVKEIL